MSAGLKKIAEQLKNKDKKVQLIYAFNGTGKTRLSREFINLNIDQNPERDQDDSLWGKILYYNSFTEDLFYWDSDSDEYNSNILKIQDNLFIKRVMNFLGKQAQDFNITKHFQRYTNSKINPNFSEDFTSIKFSLDLGNDESEKINNIKISKGEESNFIWSIFYAFLEEAINSIEEKSSQEFEGLEYIFIDDPVSSLDENHLIDVAVDLAKLIKKCDEKFNIKFIVSTHNTLFYNVLYNELSSKKICYLLERSDDGTFFLTEKKGDSNTSFSYHLHLKQTIEKAINENNIEKYHFMLLRNLYEKTANFLGYPSWLDILPNDDGKKPYFHRIIQLSSHSALSNEAIALSSPKEKELLKDLFNHLIDNYCFWKNNNKNQ